MRSTSSLSVASMSDPSMLAGAHVSAARIEPRDAVDDAPKRSAPTCDTQCGAMCMAVGLMGTVLGLTGLSMASHNALQMGSLALTVVSLLVCEFAFNALWGDGQS
jgi:hypothetical protein